MPEWPGMGDSLTYFRYDLQDPEFVSIVDMADELNGIATNGFLADFFPVFKYLPSSGMKKILPALDFIKDWAEQFIKEHRETYDAGDIDIKLNNVDVILNNALNYFFIGFY